MKKYISFFAILALAFSLQGSVARAADIGVTTTTNAAVGVTPDRGGIMTPAQKEDAQTKRQEFKAQFEALKAGIKSEKDTAKAKIEAARIAVREKVLNRFDEVVTNLTNIKARISAEITTLNGKGVDTAKAEASIAIADADLSNINGKIASINQILAKSADEITAADRATLKTLASDTQGLIKGTRQALHDAIQALKDGVKVKLETSASAHAEVNE